MSWRDAVGYREQQFWPFSVVLGSAATNQRPLRAVGIGHVRPSDCIHAVGVPTWTVVHIVVQCMPISTLVLNNN